MRINILVLWDSLALFAPGAGLGRGSQEVPGFAIGFVFGIAAVGREQNLFLMVNGFDRQDVPGVGGNDVGREEVQTITRVWEAVRGEVAFVGVTSFVLGAFDLDAQEASAVLDGEVVGRSVPEGAGDDEAMLGGLGHEQHFGPFAAQFGVCDINALIHLEA